MASGNSDLSIGYGEAKIQAKGFAGIVGILIILIFGVMFYVHSQTNMERRREHANVMDELRVITYILSQPEGKRPALAMPKSLRDRLQKSYYDE